MSNWHYNDNGAQRGPISTDELKAKIVAGELSGTSLVWQVGTKDWAEVREFSELVTEINTPPPLPKSVTIPAGTRSFATVIVDALPAIFVTLFIVGIALAIAIPQFKDSGSAIAVSVVLGLAITVGLIVWLRPTSDAMPPSHAWRRFFAKTLDVEIASVFGFVLVVLFRPESPSSVFALYLIGAVGLWGAMDIGLRGKTLGRKLFGVVIEPIPNEGGQPSYFTRFVKMNVFGLGLGIPVLATIAMAVAYKRMRETGIASWDRGYFKVGCSSGGMWKITIGILLITVLAGLQGVIAKGIEPTTREKNIDNERAEISSPTGASAPSFSVPSIYNESSQFSTSELAGKVWLLHFWSSWSPSSRDGLSVLLSMRSKMRFTVVGLSYKDDKQNTLTAIKKIGTDPHDLLGIDSDGSIGLRYGVYGVPESYLIDKSGIVRFKHIGPLTPDVIESQLLPIASKLELGAHYPNLIPQANSSGSTNHDRQGIQWKNALTNHSITLPAGWSETQFPKYMIDGYMEQFRPKGVDTAITLHSDPSKKTWDEVLKGITQEHALPNGLNIDRVIGAPSIKKIGQWTVVAANIELLLDREMKPNNGRLPNIRKLGLVDGNGNYWNISLHENKVKEIVGQQCALIRGLLKTINLTQDEIDKIISLQGYCVG